MTRGCQIARERDLTQQLTLVVNSGDSTAPTVSSINRANANPTNASSVGWNVTFSENVTGVDAGDFQLANTGLTGPGSINVTGSGANYSVTANTGTGSGTLGLNLNDNDSIADAAGNKLGGTGTGTAGGGGTGNGSFTGEVYTIDRTAANVTLTDVNGAARTFPYLTNQNVASLGGLCEPGGSPVHVTLGGNPTNPPLAPCSPSGSWTLNLTTPVSTDGVHNFAASQVDAAGNPGSSGNKPVQIDKTAPNVTATPSRSGDHNGWYNAPFTVSFSGTDTGGSGIASCDPDVNYNGPDTNGDSISGSCTDNAGNSANATYDFMYDNTKPNTTATPSREPDHNGWYNHAVTFSFSGTDATSGIDTCDPDDTYNGPDGTNLTVDGTCTDNAGNTSEPGVSDSFDYDGTAPNDVAGALNRPADHNGWYNHAVGYQFTGNDPTSGIDSCTSGTYSGPDSGSASVNGTCTDNAGNESASVAIAAFKYDATAPTSVATTLNRAPDHNGWYNASVNWTTNGNDETSGIDSCDSGTYDGPDGTDLTVSGKCTDNAGNASASADSAAFKYDATAPTVTAEADRGPDHNGWYNHALTVSFSGTDATSGNVSCDSNVNYDGPDSTDKNVSGSCTDDAGNSASDTFNFKYDATKPTISGSKSPAANSFGWNNTDVTVSYTCTDATSNVASCGLNETLSSEGANQSSTGTATDNAGNSASATVSGINIDKTAPTGIAFVGGGLTDGASYDFNSVPAGPTGCTADGSISGLQPSPDGCKVTGYDTTVGPHTVTATAKDKAGNTSTKSLSYTVKAASAKGFYQPVDMGNVTNTVKGGSTVPLKFELFGGATNTEQKNVSAVSSVSAKQITCGTTPASSDAIEEIASTNATGLRFDTTGDQFIYNWKTPKSPGTCYLVTMTAADQQTKLLAYFKLS